MVWPFMTGILHLPQRAPGGRAPRSLLRSGCRRRLPDPARLRSLDPHRHARHQPDPDRRLHALLGIGAASRKGDPAVRKRLHDDGGAHRRSGAGRLLRPRRPQTCTGPSTTSRVPVEWLNTGGAGGRLRYYASGFRNPFGILIDADGDLWLSTNGNSDPGFLSPDLVYKKVPLGGQGDFPPASFGFGPPDIVGTPIEAFANLGRARRRPAWPSCRPARTRDSSWWRSTGRPRPSRGTGCPASRSCTGAPALLVTNLARAQTGVAPDPFGRLLIADINDRRAGVARTYTGAADTTPPVAGAITPFNTRYGNWVDSPFDLSAGFSDNESAVTSCEYTSDGGSTWQPAVVTGAMPSFTCVATGIAAANGRVLRLNMRATSEGGTQQGTALSVTVDALPPTGSVKMNNNAAWTRVPTVDPRARRDGCEWCGLDVHRQHIVVHGLAAVRGDQGVDARSRGRAEGGVRVVPGSRRQRHRGPDPGPDPPGRHRARKPDRSHEQQSRGIHLVRRPHGGDSMGGRRGCR